MAKDEVIRGLQQGVHHTSMTIAPIASPTTSRALSIAGLGSVSGDYAASEGGLTVGSDGALSSRPLPEGPEFEVESVSPSMVPNYGPWQQAGAGSPAARVSFRGVQPTDAASEVSEMDMQLAEMQDELMHSRVSAEQQLGTLATTNAKLILQV